VRHNLDRLYIWSGYIGAGFIAAICALVFAQVILNAIDRIAKILTGSAIGLTIPSYADFTGFFLAAASFFALAFALREGAHIRVTLVIQHTSGWVRQIIEIFCVSLALAVSAYFSWFIALLTYESYSYNDLSPGIIAVPIWIPQFSMVLGLVVLSIALADDLVILLRGGKPSYFDKGENLLSGTTPDDQVAK
jgi:TRAP-type C4-dicarboxylate transport system permease small subunit